MTCTFENLIILNEKNVTNGSLTKPYPAFTLEGSILKAKINPHDCFSGVALKCYSLKVCNVIGHKMQFFEQVRHLLLSVEMSGSKALYNHVRHVDLLA